MLLDISANKVNSALIFVLSGVATIIIGYWGSTKIDEGINFAIIFGELVGTGLTLLGLVHLRKILLAEAYKSRIDFVMVIATLQFAIGMIMVFPEGKIFIKEYALTPLFALIIFLGGVRFCGVLDRLANECKLTEDSKRFITSRRGFFLLNLLPIISLIFYTSFVEEGQHSLYDNLGLRIFFLSMIGLPLLFFLVSTILFMLNLKKKEDRVESELFMD